MRVYRPGDKVMSAHSKKLYDITELGIMYPDCTEKKCLYGVVSVVHCLSVAFHWCHPLIQPSGTSRLYSH